MDFLNPDGTFNSSIDVNLGMILCVREERLDGVEFYIQHGSSAWNSGMMCATMKGNQSLIDFFISKGADDMHQGLIVAASNGHKEIVDFFISKGANDWVGAHAHADYHGHVDLAKFFRQKIPRPVFRDLDYGTCGICHKNDYNLGVTKCNHTFHHDCINSWYDNTCMQCPLCIKNLF